MNPYPAIFLGGFGMMATFWLTRSMRASEPVVGVTPTTLPARTAALCAVAVLPFLCGVLALFAFLHSYPVGDSAVRGVQPVGAGRRPRRADRRPVARRPVARRRAGPLGAVPGRRVRAVPDPVRLGNLVTALSISRPDSTPLVVLRLFAPFAFFTLHGDGANAHLTTWRGSPWFFIGWQLALCAIAVLVALLRGAEGRVRFADHPCPRRRGSDGRDPARAGQPRRVRPRRHRVMVIPVLRAGAWQAVAGISGVAVVVGGCGAAFPAAATVLLPICFALLGAAAAFTLDEPASLVVDVTPTGPVRRTTIRAVALLAPLAAGALVMLAAAMRGLALPWAAAGLALAGNVLLGFAAACVVRTRTGEPGATAGAAVLLVLMAPSLVPPVARWVRTFPAPGAGGPSSDHVWWIVLAVCVVAIAISIGGRSLPRWMSSVP